MNPSSPLEVLKTEFAAKEGSFLLQLRGDLTWDEVAFRRLIRAMFEVASALEKNADVPRWLAEGFWCCDTWVRDWTSHGNFAAPDPESLTLLRDVCFLFFTGENPYEGDCLREKVYGGS